MDKRTALETLEFAYEDGKYKKVICEKEGTIYKLAWEPGKTAYQVEIKKPDGSEDTQGAGKYIDTELYPKMQELAEAIDNLMKGQAEKTHEEVITPEHVTGFVEGGYKAKVQEAAYEDIGEQIEAELQPPGNEILDLECSLCRIGNIKIGKKGETRISQKSGKEFQLPEKLESFKVTTMEKGVMETDGHTDFKEDPYIMSILGNEPKTLKVRLLYDEIPKNLRTSYVKYKGSAWECRGDGKTALLKSGKIIPCKGQKCENYIKHDCKLNGVLSVMLDDAPVVGGVYQFRTTGIHSISNLTAAMKFIKKGTFGLLAYLPLMLTIAPKSVTLDNGTKTIIQEVNIVYRGSLEDMILAAKQTIQIRESLKYNERDYDLISDQTEIVPESVEERKALVEEFYVNEAKRITA